MASNNNNLININQIDVNAITEYVIAKGKLVYRDDNSGDTVKDTDKVAGIDSDLIAVAVDKNNRTTVNNALQLGGIPAANYMTINSGNSLNTLASSTKSKYGEEIKDLKDELYQLKYQLAKSGFIQNDGQYYGYHDIFNSSNPIYEKDQIGTAAATSNTNGIKINEDSCFKLLDVNDYIYIYNEALGAGFVRQVKSKNTVDNTIVLSSDVDNTLKTSSYILYKSAGILTDGMFAFAKSAENQLGSQNFYSGVSDDSFNIYKKLYNQYTGYGYNIKIPSGKTGWLSDIEFCLRSYGTPGSLMCYVIDERDIDKFRNPAQAKSAYLNAQINNNDSWHFFAESVPVSLVASEGKQYVKFSFLQNGSYPLIPTPEESQTIRYVVILELQSGNTNNYYNVLFLQHKNDDGTYGDLQLNNTTYIYNRMGNDDTTSALKTGATILDETSQKPINDFDLYYQIHTIENIQNQMQPNKYGLYSSYVYTGYDMKANRARLCLRIKREGIANITTDSSTPILVTTQTIPVVLNDSVISKIEDLNLKSNNYKPLELQNDLTDTTEQISVGVGPNICKIISSSESGITINSVDEDKPILVNNSDPVYRIGYNVALKCAKISYDPQTKKLSYGTFTRINLPLKYIYKDVDRNDNKTSDRLLFENDLPITDEYNYFEIQVNWQNTELSSYSDISTAQFGGIKQLTLSLDRYF